jgi:molybdopterin converting factor small subunit
MHIQVEFLGLSRLATGQKQISFEVPRGSTFRDLVRLLGRTYPALIGNVIQPDGETLQWPNTFNLDTRRMIQARQMSECLNDGDRVILMSLSAGG